MLPTGPENNLGALDRATPASSPKANPVALPASLDLGKSTKKTLRSVLLKEMLDANFWGLAALGNYTHAGIGNFDTPSDGFDSGPAGEMLVKEFNDLVVPAGQTLFIKARKGALLYCQGKAEIDGTIRVVSGYPCDPEEEGVPASGLQLLRRQEGAPLTQAAPALWGCGDTAANAEANQPAAETDGKLYTIAREGGSGGAKGAAGDDGLHAPGGGGGSYERVIQADVTGLGVDGSCFSGGPGAAGINGPLIVASIERTVDWVYDNGTGSTSDDIVGTALITFNIERHVIDGDTVEYRTGTVTVTPTPAYPTDKWISIKRYAWNGSDWSSQSSPLLCSVNTGETKTARVTADGFGLSVNGAANTVLWEDDLSYDPPSSNAGAQTVGGAGGTSSSAASGGAGQPPGEGFAGGVDGGEGCGGLLILLVRGDLSGNGLINCSGEAGGDGTTDIAAGSGSGGGCALVLYGGSADTPPTIDVSGGAGGAEGGLSGGDGVLTLEQIKV